MTLRDQYESWDTCIIEDPEEKATDMEAGLQKPMSDRGLSIPCLKAAGGSLPMRRLQKSHSSMQKLK